VKNFALAALAALTFVVSPAPSALAQNAAGANAQKYGIAVVDVSYIFKQHNTFRTKMDAMKGEMQGIEKQLEAERQKIVAKEGEKKGFKPGSAEFSQIDDQLATMKAQFQLNMQRLRKGFLEKEAKAYYETYQQVSQAITYYAERQKIGLVLRFNGEPADPLQRESILRVINRPVQFQNKVDITPDILAMVNRGTTAPNPSGAAPASASRPNAGLRPQ